MCSQPYRRSRLTKECVLRADRETRFEVSFLTVVLRHDGAFPCLVPAHKLSVLLPNRRGENSLPARRRSQERHLVPTAPCAAESGQWASGSQERLRDEDRCVHYKSSCGISRQHLNLSSPVKVAVQKTTITLTGTLRTLPLWKRDSKADASASILEREFVGMLSNSG